MQHCLLLKNRRCCLDTCGTTPYYLYTLLSPTHVEPFFVGPVGACGSVRHGRVHLSGAEPLRLRDMHLAVSAEVSPGEPWKPTAQSGAPSTVKKIECNDANAYLEWLKRETIVHGVILSVCWCAQLPLRFAAFLLSFSGGEKTCILGMMVSSEMALMQVGGLMRN